MIYEHSVGELEVQHASSVCQALTEVMNKYAQHLIMNFFVCVLDIVPIFQRVQFLRHAGAISGSLQPLTFPLSLPKKSSRELKFRLLTKGRLRRLLAATYATLLPW